MITIRSKALFLCACFIEVIWLLVAQTLGNTLVLLPCLACFLALMLWAAIQNIALPVILFFLPFAPLLKMRPGTVSFFTIALLMVYAVYTIIGSRRVWIFHLVPALVLIVLTAIVKTVNNYSMDNAYIMFAVTLLLVPFLSRELNGGYDFYWLTLFFVLGIGLAALTAQYLAQFPTIAQYITIDTLSGVRRWSGYYGDPNFYSTHITAALSGVLVLLLHTIQKRRLLMLALMVLLLMYCGLLSVSKSFLLVSIALLLLWVADLLLRKGKVTIKLTLIFTILILGAFFLSSTVFTDMLDVLWSRFGQDNNLSDFTTGRTELWIKYITEILEDPLLLLFGVGYTRTTIGGEASHNTLIQGVFQVGLVGGLSLLAWEVCYFRVLLDGVRMRWNQVPQLAILLCGVFGPWLALDYLVFDEFFILPMYVCVAISFLAQQGAGDSPLISSKVWVRHELSARE